MAQTVIGLFDSASDAQKAVDQLVSNGFSRSNIDVSSSGTSGAYGSSDTTSTGSSSTNLDASSSAYNTGTSGTYNSGSTDLRSADLSGTSGSYGTGSNTLGTSGLTGTGANDLSGTSNYSGSSNYSNSSTEHEGIGHSISRFFSNLFGNDDEANTYSGVANKSGSIVTVHAQSAEEAEQAADILDDNGAIDVNERASQYGLSGNASTGNYDSTRTTGTTGNVTSGDQTTSIPIIEEQLNVGKRTVETGGARLRSRIVERPVEENLRLREERVTVERNPVNRAATEADFTNFKEGTIEVTERAEVPVVAKEARVVEEVSLGKEVQEREETIRETVRKTEVDVENITDSSRSTDLTSGTTNTTSSNTGSLGTTNPLGTGGSGTSSDTASGTTSGSGIL